MANTSHGRNDPKGGGGSMSGGTSGGGASGGTGAGGMMEGAREVGRQVGERAEQATSAAGRGMQNVADTIREHAPSGGMLGGAAQAVSSTFERGGRYLENEGLSGMGNDLTSAIRNNPVPALLLAVGVGFLLARAMSRD